MIVKDILDKSSDCLIIISKNNKIVADNVNLLGDIEKYYNYEVDKISAFYTRQSIYKYGIIINV